MINSAHTPPQQKTIFELIMQDAKSKKQTKNIKHLVALNTGSKAVIRKREQAQQIIEIDTTYEARLCSAARYIKAQESLMSLLY